MTDPAYLSKSEGGEQTFYQVEDGWIETFTGQQFRFADPDPETINVTDISEGLSKLCRYNGHTRQFYSVAEHCLLLSRWYQDKHWAPQPTLEQVQFALDFHMHDASEAYLCDIPRPIKAKLPDYKRLEATLDAAIARRFGLTFPHPPLIKECDSRIIRDERAQVMNQSRNNWGTDGLEPLGVQVSFLPPWKARDAYLINFNFLTELRDDLRKQGGGGAC